MSEVKIDRGYTPERITTDEDTGRYYEFRIYNGESTNGVTRQDIPGESLPIEEPGTFWRMRDPNTQTYQLIIKAAGVEHGPN